ALDEVGETVGIDERELISQLRGHVQISLFEPECQLCCDLVEESTTAIGLLAEYEHVAAASREMLEQLLGGSLGLGVREALAVQGAAIRGVAKLLLDRAFLLASALARVPDFPTFWLSFVPGQRIAVLIPRLRRLIE